MPICALPKCITAVSPQFIRRCRVLSGPPLEHSEFRQNARSNSYFPVSLRVSGRSVSSGQGLQLLYDSRHNSINPSGGVYANVVFRANMSPLGSDNTYQSLLIEARKYIHLSKWSDNILAFWSYNALTLSGNPPFLDLPSTGWDSSNNWAGGIFRAVFGVRTSST